MQQIQAFTTKKVVSLNKSSKNRIECVYAYGDKLLVGLSNGTLSIYTVNDPFSTDIQATLSNEYSNFCKYPIEKIRILKDAGALLILSGNIINVFDMDTHVLVEQLQHTKGTTTFEVIDGIIELGGYQAMVSRLAVGCKRKLVVYEWRDSEFVTHREIQLSDRIRTISFLNHNKVICGLGSEYGIVDIEKEAVVNTIVPGNDNNSSFTSVGISYMGIGSKQPIPLSVRLGEKEGGALIVRDTVGQFIEQDGSLKQDDDERVIQFEVAPELLGFTYPYLIISCNGEIQVRNAESIELLQAIEFEGVKSLNNGKLFYAANGFEIIRLFSEDYASQIQTLATHGRLKEAISILNQIEPVLIKDKENMLRDLLMLQATEMFKDHEFEESLQLFSDISAPPSVVIALFPEEISGTLSSASSTESLHEVKPAPHNSLAPVTSNSDSIPNPEPTSTELSNEEFKIAVRKLQEFLTDTRRRIAKLRDTNEKIEFRGFELNEKIYGDLSEAAMLVDTTLFRCYVHTSPALVGPLVRVSNNCDPQVVKVKLEELGKWKELVDFYYGKGLHREALSLLKRLGTDDEDSLLSGPNPTVRYLQRLDNKNLELVFEFGKWPISVDAENGKELFMEDSRECLSLSRTKVQKFLSSLPDETRYLPIVYLEYLTGQMGDTSPNTHNSLGIMYIKSIENGDRWSRYDKFLEFLKTDEKYRADRLLLETPNSNKLFLEPRAILHGKRGEHEKALGIYAFDLNDAARAREYCAEQFKVSGDDNKGQECLHILLNLYLGRHEGEEGENREQEILELLRSQGSRMNVVEVVKSLPENIKISDMNSFLQSQIRSIHSRAMSTQLDTALRKCHLVKTQEQLLELGQRHAVITNLKTCKVCTKRLGHSVISMFPNGDVAHYGCAKQYQQVQDEQLHKQKSVKVGVHNSS